MEDTIGIVILNYLAYQETLECIESIRKQSYQKYQVVIVDNASPNESFVQLEKAFVADDQIMVVQTEENIGFAKGNNFGIDLLKQIGVFNVLVINGDTLLSDPTYLEKLITYRYPDDIAMVGTRIRSADGINQNTEPVFFNDEDQVKSFKREIAINRLITWSGLKEILKRVYPAKSPKKTPAHVSVSSGSLEILDPSREKLHGSAIFFTKTYLEKYKGFYPKTFLYFEEEFLALICRKLGMKQAYLDEVEIFHKEDASSDLLFKNNNRKSELFKLDLLIKNTELMKAGIEMTPEQLKHEVQN